MQFSLRSLLILPPVVFGMCLITGCDSSNKEATMPPAITSPSVSPSETREPVIITIGNLTDLTGPASNQFILITAALEDIVQYYNDNNVISGVELEVVSYDGQFDPSNDIPGYEWLKDRGSVLIFTGVPDTPMTLKSLVDEDKTPLFAATGYREQLDPPGYVFIMGVIPEHEVFTVLKWIAENDWDYESNGPAKIGAASWSDGHSQAFIGAMKEYTEAHPEQYEWVGEYLTNFTFNWGAEAEALKECDYVYPCLSPVPFIQAYRSVNQTA